VGDKERRTCTVVLEQERKGVSVLDPTNRRDSVTLDVFKKGLEKEK